VMSCMCAGWIRGVRRAWVPCGCWGERHKSSAGMAGARRPVNLG